MSKRINAISTAMVAIFANAALFVSAEPGNQEKPSFEVVSIKRGIQDHRTGSDFLPGGRFRAHAPLRTLISHGYEIDFLQVMGVPKSFEDIQWDIEAKPQVGKYDLNQGILDPHVGSLMVQSMLEDCFKLKVHQETRNWQGYEMVIAKGGPKMNLSQDQKRQGGVSVSPNYLEQHATSLSSLAATLSRILQFFEGEAKRFRVVDKTGLNGLYDIELRWTPNRRWASNLSTRRESNSSEITLFDAIQNQLGLKLVPADLPTPVIVVDEVQMPSTN